MELREKLQYPVELLSFDEFEQFVAEVQENRGREVVIEAYVSDEGYIRITNAFLRVRILHPSIALN